MYMKATHRDFVLLRHVDNDDGDDIHSDVDQF